MIGHHRVAALAAAVAAGCINLEPVSATAPCEEVGYAISRRTFECTADDALANERYLAFEEAYECIPIEWSVEGDTGIIYEVAPGESVNYFHCSFTIGELPCELVAEYGDDYSQWLTASEGCPLVVEERTP